jgi:hypothetical protein
MHCIVSQNNSVLKDAFCMHCIVSQNNSVLKGLSCEIEILKAKSDFVGMMPVKKHLCLYIYKEITGRWYVYRRYPPYLTVPSYPLLLV